MYSCKYDKNINLNKLSLIFIIIFTLSSCADFKANQSKKKDKIYYSSSGFALIYNEIYFQDKIISKKINNTKIETMHSFLKRNTPIKIINPKNQKSVETKIYKKSNFPSIFNIVISKELASILELDIDNPYVEIIEVKRNKTFIAKEANIFDEEKNVAEKAPVDEVKMDILTKEENKEKKKNDNNKNNYVLVISDFYYFDSANNLMKEIEKKTKINNISIKKINNVKYRLFVGPFKNFNALKSTYISLNKLGFEDLNIYTD